MSAVRDKVLFAATCDTASIMSCCLFTCTIRMYRRSLRVLNGRFAMRGPTRQGTCNFSEIGVYKEHPSINHITGWTLGFTVVSEAGRS